MIKVIGLTGSIAVGKSTVTRYLREHGFEVVDADEISRHALDIGKECYNKVVERFGCVKEDGGIDRQQLGQLVFSDPLKKKQLEDIIHPYVCQKIKEEIQASHEQYIFLDVPLLYEAGLDALCDSVIVVDLPLEKQIERLMERNHIEKQAALHLIQQQMSSEEKRKKADYIIDNSCDLHELYKNIDNVLKEVCYEVVHE